MSADPTICANKHCRNRATDKGFCDSHKNNYNEKGGKIKIQQETKKGNHVFNKLDAAVKSAFKKIAEGFGDGEILGIVLGNNGEGLDLAKSKIDSGYPKSYRIFLEIINHANIDIMHTIEDKGPVVPNDANSSGYGVAAEEFLMAVQAWAFDGEGENPAHSWQTLITVGYDNMAHIKYMESGSNNAAAPATKLKRAELCTNIEKFIKGELTMLVIKWLIALREDLSIRGVYEKDIPAWNKFLQSPKK